jgi:hypothetical protein
MSAPDLTYLACNALVLLVLKMNIMEWAIDDGCTDKLEFICIFCVARTLALFQTLVKDAIWLTLIRSGRTWNSSVLIHPPSHNMNPAHNSGVAGVKVYAK